MADVEAVTDLLNDASQADYGVRESSEQEVRESYNTPGFDLQRDSRLVVDANHNCLGVVEFYDTRGEHTRAWVFFRVHPEVKDPAIGDFLMGFADERAPLMVTQGAPDTRAILHTAIAGVNDTDRALLLRHGYTLSRYSLRMQVEFGEQPQAPPAWPAGITVRTAQPGDERAIYEADMEAFADHWGFLASPYEEWLHFAKKVNQFEPDLWFLAVEGDEIAGICLCVSSRPEDQQMAWVDTLGVRRPWRRRGVGEALLRHSFVEFQRRGKRRAALGVDAQSLTGATRLYERVGMSRVRQYEEYEKEVRPGRDLRTLSLDD
jgi:mycothiol synthase